MNPLALKDLFEIGSCLCNVHAEKCFDCQNELNFFGEFSPWLDAMGSITEAAHLRDTTWHKSHHKSPSNTRSLILILSLYSHSHKKKSHAALRIPHNQVPSNWKFPVVYRYLNEIKQFLFSDTFNPHWSQLL